MLKAKQMTRAVIVGHKDFFEDTVDALHRTNLFQIEDFIEDEESDLKIGKPFESGKEASKKLVKIRSIASLLGVKDTAAKKQATEAVCSQLDGCLDTLDDDLAAFIEKKSALEAQLKEIGTEKREILPFINIDIDLDLYRGYDSLAVFAGHVKDDIGPAISQITSAYEIFHDQQHGTMVLFVAKERSEEVNEVLSRFSFKELKIPEASGVPSLLLADIEKNEADVIKKIESIDSDIENLKAKYAELILASNEMLSVEVQKSDAPLRVATTKSSFLIDGWLPSESYDKLVNVVNNATNGHVLISTQEIRKEDENDVPVEYDNSKIVSPLQAIMDLYGRPKYKEIDPSSLIFITFPLLYGMILGDLGYGLILLSIAVVIKKLVYSDAIKRLMDVLIYCQIATLFFGLIYGEFLGFPLAGHHGTPGLIPGFEEIPLFVSPFAGEVVAYPIHRVDLVMTFMALTILVGIIHINFGFLVGFINEKMNHGFTEAMLCKGSWFIIELGIVLVVLGYLGMLPIAVGAALFIIGVLMLFKGEGVKGPLELPSLLSNPLSYTRIIAVALSHMAIASTINVIAFTMIWEFGSPIGVMTIFAILLFVFGHAFNTILSIIAPGLHSLRLQYVEFFGKFYEGGGRIYDPFGYIRKYTEEK